MQGYRQLAVELRQRIDAGEFPVGSTLPTITDLMAEYRLARQTVRDAIRVLADDGLVVTVKKAGTIVRRRTVVQIPLSRYQRVLAPGGSRGPWETAAAQQGLDGYMKLIKVERVPAAPDLAELLHLQPGDPVICRQRHAIIRPDDVVQLQRAWYPAQLAAEAGIDGVGKIEGGVLAALAAAGRVPASCDEAVAARPPTDEETSVLRIGGKIAVLTVERVTRDEHGDPIEVLRAVAPADRLHLVYDDLPLTREERA